MLYLLGEGGAVVIGFKRSLEKLVIELSIGHNSHEAFSNLYSQLLGTKGDKKPVIKLPTRRIRFMLISLSIKYFISS